MNRIDDLYDPDRQIPDWALEHDLGIREDNGPSDTTERKGGRADQFYTHIDLHPCDGCWSKDSGEACLHCSHLVEVTGTNVEDDEEWVFDDGEWRYFPIDWKKRLSRWEDNQGDDGADIYVWHNIEARDKFLARKWQYQNAEEIPF